MINRIRAGVGEAAKHTSGGPQFDELPHVGRFEQPQNLHCEARVGQWEYRIRDSWGPLPVETRGTGPPPPNFRLGGPTMVLVPPNFRSL